MSEHASWHSYHRFEGPEHWDAIVVGSGIGGLTAAVLLAKHGGKRVLVLERHWEAGGFTHTFRRPGYEWDVGVHYIGDVGRARSGTRRMFDEVTGGRVQWAPMPDVYDRVFLGERSFDLVAGRDRFAAQLKEYFPGEASAIDRYLDRIREATRGSSGFFAEKAMPAPVASLAGGWMRRRLLRWSSRTTREVLEELTSNQELIAVLTAQWGDYGLPPARSSFVIHAMVVGHYLEGGYYPVGGASVLAKSAAAELEKHGGRLLVSASVDHVLVERGRADGVTMADGRVIRAPLVVSNAGALNTFECLLREPRPSVRRTAARLRQLGSSAAHLGLYLGLDGTDAELGLEGTNLWIYRDERHEHNVERFLADPRAPLPLVYVSFPSAKDPSFQQRFPGHATVDVITLASAEWFRQWQDRPWRKRGESYEALKAELTERLLEVLHRHVPKVRGRIAVREMSTPLSTRDFVSYRDGEIYGLEHTPARFAERALRPRTPVRGLFLTGQDVCTCGVAGAMFGGAVTATAALGRPVIARVLRGTG